MQVFISHNVANKADARLLASALARRGSNVWFDEWNIRPGESIAAGIESGLAGSDIFVLIWSANAARSNWVGNEIRAYLHRRVADATLRIVPLMLDETPLPLLVADHLGFKIAAPEDFDHVAQELNGQRDDHELAQLLQKRLWELARDKIPEGSPHRFIICPQCGSPDLMHTAFFDGYKEKMNYAVMCLEENCKFMRSQFGE
ncbi:MAG TPA: toll/interleukin-1 receptor domain-containing protein [Pyrinomonadaceae bacterium]|nr:toll/interleukin-1 receptor domain-containing protein [Pyrinomonadaceae bacterium]